METLIENTAAPSVEGPRLVRLRTRTPYGEWFGDVVPENGAKHWVASQTEKHPRNYTFDYTPVRREVPA